MDYNDDVFDNKWFRVEDSKYHIGVEDRAVMVLPQGSDVDDKAMILDFPHAILLELERIANALEAGNEND